MRLPDDKVIIPGVIDSTTNFIEHPELVAQRIVRYAEVVGRERVIAGTDCGFATFARSQPPSSPRSSGPSSSPWPRARGWRPASSGDRRLIMLMRKLGRTGLKVSALCLGGNTFGWTTDQKASEAVLDAYVEAGGNFIDTADVYSRWAPGNKGGESETALGTLAGCAQESRGVLIATKVWGRWARVRTTPASRAPTSWRAWRPRCDG